jgi:prepilin-type N-terminal cleavage/methylation domain-containing protein/prepilin-type processing-associated H-X9-DG protein
LSFSSFQRRHAFTLIELLVVIALIAILAAILFPVFAQAREQGRKGTCTSNQRQIAMAFRLYTQDYDEGYPNTQDPYLWVGKRFRVPIMPYLGIGQRVRNDGTFNAETGAPAILICPSDTLSGTGFDATSYGYSACFYHTPEQINAMELGNLRLALQDPGAGAQCTTQTEAAVLFPAQKALLGEWFNSHQYEKQRLGLWGTMKGARLAGEDRWQGARNYAFADGHVKFVPASRIHPAVDDSPNIHLTRNGISGRDVD